MATVAGQTPACPLCDQLPDSFAVDPRRDIYIVTCKVCGRFLITDEAAAVLEANKALRSRRYVLSNLTRKATAGKRRLELLSTNLEQLVNEAVVPQTPLEPMDDVLLYVAGGIKEFGEQAVIPWQDYSLFGFKSWSEFKRVLGMMQEFEWGRLGDAEGGAYFTLWRKGWERISELRERIPKSRQAFVAMNFHADLQPAYTDGIKPALRSVGYQPLRIDEVHHNERIDDRIIAEIRKSGLVVADFTGHRGGVYFETGYALGLGLPVIWTCRADEVEAAHFDTRQFNHITWNSPQDLHEKLRTRIQATLPVYPAIT